MSNNLIRNNQQFVEEPIKVYIKINEEEFITNIASSIFLKDTTDWLEIDSGFGDKFAHAQNNYFDMPLLDENGNYQIKYVKNKNR